MRVKASHRLGESIVEIAEHEGPLVEQRGRGRRFVPSAYRNEGTEIADTDPADRQKAEQPGAPGVGVAWTFDLLDDTAEHVGHRLRPGVGLRAAASKAEHRKRDTEGCFDLVGQPTHLQGNALEHRPPQDLVSSILDKEREILRLIEEILTEVEALA